MYAIVCRYQITFFDTIYLLKAKGTRMGLIEIDLKDEDIIWIDDSKVLMNRERERSFICAVVQEIRNAKLV